MYTVHDNVIATDIRETDSEVVTTGPFEIVRCN